MKTREVRTISRKDSRLIENPQRLYAEPLPEESVGDQRMRQSELHGDMQSQAETTWPLAGARSNKLNGPKVAKFLVG